MAKVRTMGVYKEDCLQTFLSCDYYLRRSSNTIAGEVLKRKTLCESAREKQKWTYTVVSKGVETRTRAPYVSCFWCDPRMCWVVYQLRRRIIHGRWRWRKLLYTQTRYDIDKLSIGQSS